MRLGRVLACLAATTLTASVIACNQQSTPNAIEESSLYSVKAIENVQTRTIGYYNGFDLDTGAVVCVDNGFPGCYGFEYEFRFAYGGNTPHTVVFQNQQYFGQENSVHIAYSGEAFSSVTYSDIVNLTFTENLIDVPFNQVAVIKATSGKYYKMELISEGDEVSFRYSELYSLSPQQAAQLIISKITSLADSNSISSGQASALKTKLEEAIKKLDIEKVNTAANQINAFINQVNGLVAGGVLSLSQGQDLVSAANELLEQIGG